MSAGAMSRVYGQAASSAAPVLLSDAASTRAIAINSVTWHGEPFPHTSQIAWSADQRTRLMLFAMNLELLAGEDPLKAITADAEDSGGRIYPLKVEYVEKVPANEWMYSVTVRLHDELVDPGDVLIRISLHGASSSRVRVAIGHTGGGPANDSASVPTPAPPVPPAPTPTPTPKTYTASATSADTIRFLEQTTWGPTSAEAARVQSMGLRGFLNEQFAALASSYPTMTLMPADSNLGCPSGSVATCVRDNYSMYPLQRRFFESAMTGPDQLRQRIAFALHQILVVSGRDITQPSQMTPYLQILDRNAFGNFRQLLYEITLNAGMGSYLDMAGNNKSNPNENYAREILQLFSIGVDELNPDGTPKLDAEGKRIPSYDQEDVNAFARVFTGWNFAATKQTTVNGTAYTVTNFHDPMTARDANHDTNQKTLLGGVVLPANQTTATELNAALDNIFNHPNTGPFIGKALIQHLVTSNPSPTYVERVAAVFNNDCNGLYPESCTGARGNLRAVVRAILLDPEARGDIKNDPNYGRLREPVQFINSILRAFNAKSFDKTTASDGYLNPQASTLDQDVFRPATVFSYYPPDYEVPGTKLLGPAFGILSTSTALRRANFVNTIVYSGIAKSSDPVTGNAPLGTSLDLAPLEALAGDPAQLVKALDTLLMHGRMSASMRTATTNAVTSIPTSDANYARKRAQVAVYLVATSSQYQVER
ncbi:MAG TPA: DUF1800 domain-containing protein [Pyrinomonadaceae bacterium]|nr:DUF1800 domain-containing protein [Pyrinomonadaceae bacterium]